MEEITQVYCQIPYGFDADQMIFTTSADKENVSEDDDDGADDDFD